RHDRWRNGARRRHRHPRARRSRAGDLPAPQPGLRVPGVPRPAASHGRRQRRLAAPAAALARRGARRRDARRGRARRLRSTAAAERDRRLNLALLRQLSWPELRHHPWRAGAALLAVTLGVALAFSVHLINASALAEFGAAVRAINGDADLELVGPRAGFDEAL